MPPMTSVCCSLLPNRMQVFVMVSLDLTPRQNQPKLSMIHILVG